ncbi:amp dependent CoA ligase [Mycena filopes]|nr:amp dependent CoA ligase [Mycena filopes]
MIYTSPMDSVPYFPDDLTLPQFLLDYEHPIRLAREPETPWLIDGRTGRSLLKAEVIRRTWSLANGLSFRAAIVGIISENNLDFPIAIWAAHRLGASVFTVNPTYTVDELIPHLADMKPSLLMVHSSALENVRKAAKHCGIPDAKIVLFDGPPANTTFATVQNFVDAGAAIQESYWFKEFKMKPGEGKTKVALYFPSSGTTGVPKMVAIPHSSFISNIIQTAAHDAGIGAAVPVAERRFKPGNVSCADIFGLLINLHYMLFSGMTVVILPKFDFMEYLATIKKYKHPAVKSADLSSLRVVFVGGAPLSVPLAEAMGELIPHAVVEQGYGMTELTGTLTMPPLNRRVATDAVGHLLPGFTARVVKPDGSLAGIGETGELYVTGPSLATHYVNNEQISRDTFIDGWVRTGDEVYFDENLELHIVDRIKDFIKVGGYQVAPAELEARLVTNADITDCCVVPILHKFSGEVPRAYVVLSTDALARIRASPLEGEKIKRALIEDIANSKAKYKGLAGGVEFVDVIPKTASGKLLRRALRDLGAAPGAKL